MDVSLELEENLLNRLYEYGMKSYPNEFGGVLVGQYSPDRKILFIQDTILTRESGGSKYNFVRSNDGLKEELERRFNQKSKQIYVGEWHTHPDMPAYPSYKDRDAMKSLAHHPEVYILNPVLLIISNSKTSFTYKFYVQYENQLYVFTEKES